MDERDRSQADAVLRLVQRVLRDDLVGAYLYGSATAGGLRPNSDLDVLAVSRRSLGPADRVAMLAGLLDVSGRRARVVPGRPVELTVVVDSEVDPWRWPPTVDLQYGEWLRDEYEAGAVPQPCPDPDLAVLLTTAAAHGVALHGPPPRSVLPEVPAADLRRAVVAAVPDLLAELPSDARNVLLTLARIWTTLVTGAVVPKDDAADWALGRLPAGHRAALRLARDGYRGEADDVGDEQVERV